MTNEPSPHPWRVRMETRDIYERRGTFAHIENANGETICTTVTTRCDADAALICDAVNLKARIDEAMADESGYLHPVVLDGKPMVYVTPPPSESEESRMHREYETGLLVDRERFQRGYYEVVEECDRLRDLVRRLLPFAAERLATMNAADSALLREARAALGEDRP